MVKYTQAVNSVKKRFYVGILRSDCQKDFGKFVCLKVFKLSHKHKVEEITLINQLQSRRTFDIFLFFSPRSNYVPCISLGKINYSFI